METGKVQIGGLFGGVGRSGSGPSSATPSKGTGRWVAPASYCGFRSSKKLEDVQKNPGRGELRVDAQEMPDIPGCL
jgi:hypothetical protein